MILKQSFKISNRKQAAILLAEKLTQFKNSDAVVVGIPYGGALIGHHLAKILNVPFDVIACKTIAHPADPRRSIGSVSADQVVIHDEAYDIPRDYIYHQIVLNQRALMAKQRLYHAGKHEGVNVRGAVVLLTGDIVKGADILMASIKTVESQHPKKIIVAAPVLTPEAVRQLACEVDDIVSLAIEDDIQPADVYDEFSIVRDEDIMDLVLNSFSKK